MIEPVKRPRGRPKKYFEDKHTCDLPMRCKILKEYRCCYLCDRREVCPEQCLNSPARCGYYQVNEKLEVHA